MRIYIEVDIEDGAGAVANALERLSSAILTRELVHEDALESRTVGLGVYETVDPRITDISIR